MPPGQEHSTATAFADLTTPALLMDRDRLRANAARLAQRTGALGCVLRPHVKTHKSVDVAREIEAAGHTRGITVSTLKEAGHFFAHGFSDILYAVGVSPNKFAQVAALIRRGCDLCVVLDSLSMARALADFGAAQDVAVPVLIELDTDGHRAGLSPDSDELLPLAQLLHESTHVELRGVMTHAGESYHCTTADALRSMARAERDGTLGAAQRLRDAGLPCPVTSIGSTPTAFAIDALDGITELRAGVYAFFDLVMAGIGVCSEGDIALSVLVTVTGHQAARQWIITDGGWMALSRDRGTAQQAVDCGYGLVLDPAGRPIPELIVSSANQEHGIITARNGQLLNLENHPIGSQLRIVPNHACATAAQHGGFHVLEGGRATTYWPRIQGW